ncbi:MAG: 3-hydroxyacyl-[acyl-carrier-protein] dehydratase FabZ [Myxococcota bacterium]|nr:3-hydroxyacyl-[acyl-carrier-protein] dehydratase FabZ [Myxococcota bacterium]
MTRGIRHIQQVLPHRFPFLLVDRVEDFRANEWIRGFKNVTINEPFFPGHFPEHPVLPGVMTLEALSQLAGLLVYESGGYDPERDLFLLTGLDKVKFRRQVIPGDRLDMECRILQQKLGVWKQSARAQAGGELACEAVITARVIRKAE